MTCLPRYALELKLKRRLPESVESPTDQSERRPIARHVVQGWLVQQPTVSRHAAWQGEQDERWC